MSLDKEIEALESTLIRLKQLKEYQVEPIKWEPKGGDWWIGDGGIVYKSIIGFSQISKIFATGRKTKEQAQRAAVEMRRFNRLLALRDELCGNVEVDWQNGIERKYCLYYSHDRETWDLDWHDTIESIRPYFTTREAAQKACDMLNSGEVEL